MDSPASQTITAIVFGVTATVISIAAAWQTYRVMRLRRTNRQTDASQDLEMGRLSRDSERLHAVGQADD